jgi:hypothetical protein
MSNSKFRQDQVRKARVLGAVVATICVVGLAGVLWLHAENPLAPMFETATRAPAPADDVFLHAPATVIAIPSAEQVFASGRGASMDDAPAAPTF